MSAWIVSDSHIDVLVAGIVRKGLTDGLSPTEIGRELVIENHRSIEARYGPGTDARDPDDEYEYVPVTVPLTDENLASAAACYDYQTCEHSGYESSRARRWAMALEELVEDRNVIHGEKVDLSVGSPWGFEDRHVHPNGREQADG